MFLVVSSVCICMEVNILSPVLKGITSGMFRLIILNLNQLMRKKKKNQFHQLMKAQSNESKHPDRGSQLH